MISPFHLFFSGIVASLILVLTYFYITTKLTGRDDVSDQVERYYTL